MDTIAQFFSNNFQNCIWFAVLLVAMCPTLESKIAIPLAMNNLIWKGNAFSPFSAFLLSFIGSIIPCFLIMIIARKSKKHFSVMLHSSFLQKYIVRGVKIEKASSSMKKYIALTGLVALPIPLTGVWTGSLIGGLSNLNLKYAFLSICAGALLSSGIITILCVCLQNSINAIFISSLVLVILFMLIEFLCSVFKNKKSGMS